MELTDCTRYLDVGYNSMCKKCHQLTNCLFELHEHQTGDVVEYKLGSTFCETCLKRPRVIIDADFYWYDYFDYELYNHQVEYVRVKW